jgi:hypothetical protein
MREWMDGLKGVGGDGLMDGWTDEWVNVFVGV